MKLRHLAAAVAAIGGFAVIAVTLAVGQRTEPLPPALSAAAAW